MRAAIMALAAAAALFILPAAAHDMTAGDLVVTQATARPHTSGRPTAAYMAIANKGTEAERLVGARSPDFEAAELHESVEENGMSRMRRVETLEIAADETVLLEPGALHLMLFGGREAHSEGDEFPLVLIFENAGEVEVSVMVSRTDSPTMSETENAQHHGHGDD